jgi:hypothetical protein
MADMPVPQTLPNLLVIGAQKAGTTWLHDRLGRHPDIFMSQPKELGFFTGTRLQAGLADYAAHFAGGVGARWRGESTPGYFWTRDPAPDAWSAHYPQRNPGVPGAVRKLLGPDTRILLSLRHPVLRAVSAYVHHYKMGRIDPAVPFDQAIRRHGIVDIGRYARHYRAWRKAFPETLETVFLEDIAADGQAVLDHLFAWLDVPAWAVAEAARPFHAGLDLVLADGALQVAETPRNAAQLKRPDVAALPARITQADLDLLQTLLAADIAWAERRFDIARLGWSRPLRLADLADQRARAGSASAG